MLHLAKTIPAMPSAILKSRTPTLIFEPKLEASKEESPGRYIIVTPRTKKK